MLLNKPKVKVYSVIIFTILLIFYGNNFKIEVNSINSLNNRSNENTLNRNDWNLGDYSILIDDKDPNYNWNKTAFENNWCYGEGTIENPYIIENITIQTAYPNKCIIIKNSLPYFIVRNCIFHDCFVGIDLFNVSNGLIFNNTFLNLDGKSIYLEMCVNITISTNNLTQVCYMGIACEQSMNITILQNKIETICGINYGLFCYNLNYSRIINNIIRFNAGYNKIGLFYSHHNYIHNNSLLLRGGDGIHALGSCYNNISNNLIKDSSWGVFLEINCNHNLILSNIIKQRESGIRIYLNCNFNVINNNTLEFKDFESPSANGIEIFFSNYCNITFNNIAYYNSYGITLGYSNFSYILNNTLFKNFKGCIREFNCIGNIFINNECIPKTKPYEITGFNFLIIITIILSYIIFIKKRKKIFEF